MGIDTRAARKTRVLEDLGKPRDRWKRAPRWGRAGPRQLLTPWTSDHGLWLPQESGWQDTEAWCYSQLGVLSLPGVSTNVLQEQLSLGTWSGSLQVTSGQDTESDAEERKDSGTPGWKGRVPLLMTHVGVVTLPFNLTLNVTRHDTSRVKMDRDPEPFPSP